MFRAIDDAGVPPGTRGLPLVGDLLAIGRDQVGFLPKLHQHYGDVAEFSLGSKRVAAFFHPDDVATVFAAAAADGPLGRGQEGTYARHVGVTGNTGLILSEGTHWQRQRHTLQPCMRDQWIARYAKVAVTFSEQAIASWSAGQTRDAQQDMEQLVGRIAVKTLLGVDLDNATAEKLKRTSDRMLLLNTLEYALGSKLPLWFPTPLRSLLKRTSKRMERHIMTAVDQRLNGAAVDDHERDKDMLDMLLGARDADGQPLTDVELRDEIYTLYLAGYETTANTLGIVWTLLARRADLQRRLCREIESVVGNGPLGYQHVDDLVLAGAVVKETLRMYPVVRAMSHNVNGSLRVAGYDFQPGHLLWVVPPVTQRDSRWFPQPDEFRPDRWLDGSTENIPRFAWFPFGGGPRICLGKRLATSQAVLIIAAVLRKFALSAAPGEADELTPRVNGGGHLMSANARILLSNHAVGA